MKFSLAVIAAFAAATSAVPLRVISFEGNPELVKHFEGLSDVGPQDLYHHTTFWNDKTNDGGAAAAAPPKEWRVLSTADGKPIHGKPCHGAGAKSPSGPGSFFPGPIGSLLSRLGFAPRERGAHHPHQHGGHREPAEHHTTHVQMEVVSALKDETESHRFMDMWRDHVQDMIHGFREEGKTIQDMIHNIKEDVEGKAVPYMEGGMVKILPIMNDQGGFAPAHEVDQKQYEESKVDEATRIKQWDAMEGKNGVKAHHHHHHGHHVHGQHGHRMGGKFGCRLNRALRSLRPVESIALAFVLGAGIGSILHFFFMVFILSLRRLRCRRNGNTEGGPVIGSCAQRRAERREARRARRAERKAKKEAAKAAKAGGAVRLEEDSEEGEGEMLPSYAEGERDRLVEKA